MPRLLKPEQERFDLVLDRDIAEKLRALAKKSHLSRSDVIRQLILAAELGK